MLADLREIARGIYPPLLADRGLGAAVEAQARRAAIPTTVQAQGVGRYTRDVESTVYFSVIEALGKSRGPEDLRTAGQRYHDALQEGCELLIRARMGRVSTKGGGTAGTACQTSGWP